MATDRMLREENVTTRKLWFGFVTSACAWVALGVTDIIINWRTCAANFGNGVVAGGHEGGRMLSFGIAMLLLIIALVSGFTSYRNWRALSAARNVIEAEAVGRREFMAMLGVIVTVTLGMGIIWLSLGPLFILACQRAK